MLVQCGNPWTTAISWLVKNLMAQALRAACQLVVITTHHVGLATATFQAHLVTAISTQHHVRVICPRRIWCRLFILSPLTLDNNKDRDCINRYHKWSVSILIDSCFSKSSWECKIWALISIHLLTKQHFYNQNKRTSNYAFYMCLESLWYASTDMYDKTKNYHWNIPIASLLLQL